MPADTPLKRLSAMNISLPFRGLNVVPQTSDSEAERRAVMYYYSGITSGPQPGGGAANDIIYLHHHAMDIHKGVCIIG